MTHRASVNLHFDVDEIGHRYKRGSFATLDIIAASGEVQAYLHFADSAMIDKAIAELVALKQEMDPPVITPAALPVYRLACGCTDGTCVCVGCVNGKVHEPGTGWHCDEHGKTSIAPPVITDSDRTCDQANPDTGAWCHRGGDHGVHRDTDGEEWRTDLAYTGHLRTPAIPAGPDDPHRLALAGPPYASEGIDGLRWDNMSSSGGEQ